MVRRWVGTGVFVALLSVSCNGSGSGPSDPALSPTVSTLAPTPTVNTLAPTRPSPDASTGGPADLVWTSSSWVTMPWPDDVAVAGDGRVYVRDVAKARITTLDAEGDIVGGWGGAGTGEGQFEFRDYEDPHAASYGGMTIVDDVVYVADKSRVQLFDLDGRYRGSWGSRGRGPGQFLKVFGMAGGPDGHVYIVDEVLDIVQSFTTRGRPVARWPLEVKTLRYPTALCVTPRNEVVVTDVKGDLLAERPAVRIHKFSSTGRLVTSWGRADDNDGSFDPGEFMNGGRGIACSDDGRVYVTDDTVNVIQVFDLRGRYLFSFGGPLGSQPNAAVAVSGDSVFSTDGGAGTVSRFRLSR